MEHSMKQILHSAVLASTMLLAGLSPEALDAAAAPYDLDAQYDLALKSAALEETAGRLQNYSLFEAHLIQGAGGDISAVNRKAGKTTSCILLLMLPKDSE